MNWTKEDAEKYWELAIKFVELRSRLEVERRISDDLWDDIETLKNKYGGTIPKQEETK